jgi:hypothetical protein
MRAITSLEAQIAAAYPDSWVMAALLSQSPADRRRAPRRSAAPAPPARDTGRGDAASRPRGTYELIRAYAATLTPGPDGTAPIDPAAALRWLLASGTWPHAGRPEREQRKLVMATLANLASKGHVRKAEGVASYRTHPPGPGVVPATAGQRPGQR